MQTLKIKIEAFGAIERILPQTLEMLCSSGQSVADVLDQVVQDYPESNPLLQRCACAMGEDIIPRKATLEKDSTLVLLSPVAGG